MAEIGSVFKAISPVAAITSAIFGGKPKAPKAAVPLPQATVRSNSVALDALSSRRGSAVNQRTGTGGAESRTTARKQLLGQ